MATFYYSFRPRDIRPAEMGEMAALISAGGCIRTPTKNNPERLIVPHRLPPHITDKAADCGGFKVMKKYQGIYPFSLEDYWTWLDACQPRWAAMWDYCCMATETGASLSPDQVQQNQRNTTDKAWEIWRTYRDTPWAWVPTIQGYTVQQYAQHARQMAPLIHEMWAYYQIWGYYEQFLDSTQEPPTMRRYRAFRVGIGSLVGRDHPIFVRQVVLAIQDILGSFLPLHLWGVKLRYLKSGQQMKGVVSYDSGAFNKRFGKNLEVQKEEQEELMETQAQHLWRKLQPEYADKVAPTLLLPTYQPLFPPTTIHMI